MGHLDVERRGGRKRKFDSSIPHLEGCCGDALLVANGGQIVNATVETFGRHIS